MEIRRHLGIQLQSWLDEDGRAEQPVEQQPLRCILCPKSLLLNPHSLRRYLATPAHSVSSKPAFGCCPASTYRVLSVSSRCISHLASEKHKKRVKKASSEGDGEDPLSYLRFAATVRTEAEATETHAERLQRVRKLQKGMPEAQHC